VTSQRKGGEVDPGRPALRSLAQVGQVAGADLDACRRCDEFSDFARSEAQLPRPDLG